MGRADYYADGQWDIICDRCGGKLKSGEARKEYDGYIVHEKCWYPRHPQEFNRGVKDDQSVPFSRSGVPIDLTTGYAQVVNGSVFVYEPDILGTSTVALTLAFPEGVIGTVSYTITAGSGFTINSTSVMDLSVYSYVVTI